MYYYIYLKILVIGLVVLLKIIRFFVLWKKKGSLIFLYNRSNKKVSFVNNFDREEFLLYKYYMNFRMMIVLVKL